MLMLITMLSNSCIAGDLALNAYIGIPLGSGSPFFGVTSTALDAGTSTNVDYEFAIAPRVELDLRFGAEKRPVFSVNGIPVTYLPIRRAFDKSESNGALNRFDWPTILGVALGVGLIVAVVKSDDTSVNVCSGPNCGTEEKPPPEPKPEPTTGPAEGTK